MNKISENFRLKDNGIDYVLKEHFTHSRNLISSEIKSFWTISR